MDCDISRRSLLLGGAITLCSPLLRAGTPKRIYGVLLRGITNIEYGFEDYFRINKYPIQISYVNINRDFNRIPDIIADIKKVKPDLIYSWGTPITLGLIGQFDSIDPKKHITTIPTVFTAVADPVGSRIIESSLWPNRNATGAAMISSIDHCLDAMITLKKAKKIGMLYSSTEPNSILTLSKCKHYCLINDIDFLAIPLTLGVLNKADISSTIKSIYDLSDHGVEWLLLPPDSTISVITKDFIIPTTRKINLPTFATTEHLMDVGATAGYFFPYYRLGLNTGEVALKILQGRSPMQLEVRQPIRFNYQARWNELQRLNIKVPLLLNQLQLI